MKRKILAILVLVLLLATQAESSDTNITYIPMVIRADEVRLGTAIAYNHMDEPEYVSVVTTYYDQITPENEGKYWFVSAYGWGAMDAIVEFANENGIQVNYHTLMWTYPAVQPPDETAWITEAMTRYPSIHDWQVWNEHDPSVPGIETAYTTARRVRPDAALWYNGILTGVAEQEQVKDLIAAGLVDAVGIQMHSSLETDLSVYVEFLSWLRDNGIRWQVTEADVSIPDTSPASLAAQASMYADMLALVREYGGETFGTWGFIDFASWLEYSYPLPWASDYTPKPAWFVLNGSEE
mgnify:FL=1